MNQQYGQLILLTKEQTMEMREGLYRIEVKSEAAPYSWNDFKKLSRISNNAVKHMLGFAEKVGAKSYCWHCNFKPVTSEYW